MHVVEPARVDPQHAEYEVEPRGAQLAVLVAPVELERVQPRAEVSGEGAPGVPVEVRRQKVLVHGDVEVARVLDEEGVRAEQPAGARVQRGFFAVGEVSRGEVFGEEGVVEEEVREGLHVEGDFVPHQMQVGLLGDEDFAADDALAVQRPDVPSAADEPEVLVDVVQSADAELTDKVGFDSVIGPEHRHTELEGGKCGRAGGAPGGSGQGGSGWDGSGRRGGERHFETRMGHICKAISRYRFQEKTGMPLLTPPSVNIYALLSGAHKLFFFISAGWLWLRPSVSAADTHPRMHQPQCRSARIQITEASVHRHTVALQTIAVPGLDRMGLWEPLNAARPHMRVWRSYLAIIHRDIPHSWYITLV